MKNNEIIKFHNYIANCEKSIRESDGTLRRGQLYYNNVSNYFNIDLTDIVNTDKDPFHIDDNLPNFLIYILNNITYE